MQEKLKSLRTEALKDLQSAETLEQLKEVERKVLGKNGELTELLKGVKDLSIEEKQKTGKAINELKVVLEAEFKQAARVLERKQIDKALESDWIDLSLPGEKFAMGSVHPVPQTQEEVERIFQQMGFTVVDGPEIESEFYNFEGLNVPAHHPARDMQDTFFLDKDTDHEEGKLVLRTQTSPNQIRAMRKYGAPLRIIVPGRVFRNEATDASHEHTFDQVEGLLIDTDVSIASLKAVMRDFLSRLFKKDMKVRFRPGYFPFVEPGIELDMSCVFCDGKGCRVCKRTGWIEFMGCGMVHPNVLKAGGVDSKKYQGWAFGFGLTRLVMMRYGIDDIRHLQSGDLRFNKQF
ncbi:MAG: phenylalanine--tRNA ligase subunit alpha [Candidatus Gracilibacteria bacterium]|jgi:phenylalanyl-tRNA synthetase alpha chain